MKFLVTGGAGFIGSFFIKHILLKEKNCQILNIDKLSYASDLRRLADVESKKYSFIKLDLTNKRKIDDIVESFKADVVVHFAAESHVDKSIQKSDDFINSNILGTYNLLNSFKKLRKKNDFIFIHFSTDEVYGSIKKGSFDESSPYDPSSPYSASKASADMLVSAWNKTYDFPSLIINSTNNYGPFQFPEKLIPVVICSALQNKKIPVYGDGLNVRDWIHVKDNVECIYRLICERPEEKKINISSNEEKNNLWIVKKICEFLDKIEPKKKSYLKLIDFVDDRLGHDRRYSLSNKKLKKIMNWKPKTTLLEGLENTVKWYHNNQEWWSRYWS